MARRASLDVEDSKIREVITLLEAESPITKKDACLKLGIAYNTTRLANIITEYKERKEREAKIRKSLRSKPLTIDEKKDIIQNFLADVSVSEISKSSYRSLSVVKNVLVEYNIPLKHKGIENTYKNPPLLDDESIAEDYVKGDLVFSARYGCAAEIERLFKDTKEHGKVYRIWLLGKEQQYAYQPYYELGDLRKVTKELGIKIPHKDGVMARPLIIK